MRLPSLEGDQHRGGDRRKEEGPGPAGPIGEQGAGGEPEEDRRPDQFRQARETKDIAEQVEVTDNESNHEGEPQVEGRHGRHDDSRNDQHHDIEGRKPAARLKFGRGHSPILAE